MSKTTKQPRLSSTRLVIVTGIIAGLLLVIANSALWANKYLFNAENFSDLTVNALTSDSSRAAIAGALTETIYQNRPVARAVLSDPTSELLNNMLNSERTKGALDAAATRLNVMLTSKEKEQISLDLTTIKSVLTRLAGATDGKSAERLDPATIPDTIVLFDSAKLPDLYKYASAVLLVGLLALLSALILLAVPFIKDKSNWRNILRLQGLVVSVASILALCIGPIFRPKVVGAVSEDAQRTVLANIYDTFVATFNTQTAVLLMIGVLMIMAPWLFDWGTKLLHLVASKTKSTTKPTPRK